MVTSVNCNLLLPWLLLFDIDKELLLLRLIEDCEVEKSLEEEGIG